MRLINRIDADTCMNNLISSYGARNYCFTKQYYSQWHETYTLHYIGLQ